MSDVQNRVLFSRMVCRSMPVEPEEWYGLIIYDYGEGTYEVANTAKGIQINSLHHIMDVAMRTGVVRVLMWIERLSAIDVLELGLE